MKKNVLYQVPNKILINDEDISSMISVDISEKINLIDKKSINVFRTKTNNLFCKSYSYFLFMFSNKILYKNYNNYKSKGWYDINCILMKFKSHYFTKYKEETIYCRNDIEYLKKFYTFKESSKIIPHKEKYFKHLSNFFERPMYNNIYYNKLRKSKAYTKLNLYKIKKLQNKSDKNKKDFNKKHSCKNSEENIVFSKDIINIIENYSIKNQKDGTNKYNIIKSNKHNIVFSLDNKQFQTNDTETLKLSETEEDLLTNIFYNDDSSLTLMVKNLSNFPKKKKKCFNNKSPKFFTDNSSPNTTRNIINSSLPNSMFISNSNTRSQTKSKNNNDSQKLYIKKNKNYFTIKINGIFINKINNIKNKENIKIFNSPTYTPNLRNNICSQDQRTIKKIYSNTNEFYNKNSLKKSNDKTNSISKELFKKRLKNKEKHNKFNKTDTKKLLINSKNNILLDKKNVKHKKMISLNTNSFRNCSSITNFKFVNNILSNKKLNKNINSSSSKNSKIFSIKTESNIMNYMKFQKKKQIYNSINKKKIIASFDKKNKYKINNISKRDNASNWSKVINKCYKTIESKKIIYGRNTYNNKYNYNYINMKV